MEQAEQANIAKTGFLTADEPRYPHTDQWDTRNGGYLSVLYRKSQKQEECLDKILLSSTFLMELVNDVLDMNKLESGQIQLSEDSFDLQDIFK